MTPSDREQKRKSPVHLLFLPVTFLSGAAFCYLSVQLVCAVARLLRPSATSFENHSEPAKTLIVIPILFASIAVGLLATNWIIWAIPPARRFFIREAAQRRGKSFASTNRELLKLAMYSIPPLFCFALCVALFAR